MFKYNKWKQNFSNELHTYYHFLYKGLEKPTKMLLFTHIELCVFIFYKLIGENKNHKMIQKYHTRVI